MTLPDGLRPLGRLAQYMNYWRIHDSPPVILTMDHRAVLVTAWAAQREGLFPQPPLLLRFDAHLDMGEKPRPWAAERQQLTDLDSVHALANDQRHDDGGWVITAMQWGLVGDVVTAFVHDYHRFPGDCTYYRDHLGERHELSSHDSLTDLRSGTRQNRLIEIPRPLWIDIDLDFATNRTDEGGATPWTEEDWAAQFPPNNAEWFAAMLRRADLVTIAAEPEYCSGMEACGLIARGLRNVMRPHGDWFARL